MESCWLNKAKISLSVVMQGVVLFLNSKLDAFMHVDHMEIDSIPEQD